jgi:hypothetical protein
MSQTKTITFDAVLEDDNITIPTSYRNELVALFKDKKVRVTVQSAEEPAKKPLSNMDDWQKTHDSFIQYLIDNPIEIENPIRLTRDQMHER